MNTSRKLLLAGVAAISTTAATSSAFAQSSASATATASVTVFQPISLAATSQLAFGKVTKPSSGTQSFVIAAANAATSITGSGSGGTFVPGFTQTRAVFRATGEGGQAVTFTVPATVSMGGLTLTTTNTGTTGSLSGSIGSAGTLDLGVGGSIDIAANTVSAAYSGNIVVSVAYN